MSTLHALDPRDLPLWGQGPPEPRTRASNNPTLLFSWWCTIFSAVIIITRLCGRKTRSNVLFREDWIMMLALIPLMVRMGFIHVVLIYGTNNSELEHRSVGARLVLAARIFYAMFIWLSKLTISEFLKRITIRIWRRSYELTLRGVRIFLVITFFIVVILTLCECQPFDHYWQVVPDPGPHCRQGFGNLIAMGTCDVITDILLIAFPIPIIMKSGQTWKRKFQLVSLFSLSIILIVVTLLRVPKVIERGGRQQYRTVWASCEILASAAVSNTVIIGSFLRDKGTKKNKYRSSSVTDSIDRTSARRPTLATIHSTDSDEDLFRFLGMRVPEHLRDTSERGPRPAPAAEPASPHRPSGQVGRLPNKSSQDRGDTNSSDSDDSLRKSVAAEPKSRSPPPQSTTRLSFFDVGGLLENGQKRSSSGSRARSPASQDHSANGVLTHDFAPSTPTFSRRGSQAHDFAYPTPESRRNSRAAALAHLQDIGGLLTPSTSHASSGMDRYHGRRQSDSHIHPPPRHTRPAPTGILGPMLERHETQHSLQDVGGLLGSVAEGGRGGRLARIQSDSAAEGVQTRATSSTMRPSATAEDDIELTDLGGLMAADHEPDASAASLQRATGSTAQNRPLPRAVPSPLQQDAGWESLDIEDPGGLLSKP
ncbi:uncharacterized protein LTR77_000949 [Saxophila tyrrhenica]|uniref:Rhodopsin domain-containing protein n=1 Tax=Saxophila tyrrhenica TaxID=1690608 RepID=A0AAV9PS04_9PEZI|nr:hypothetical protein LTR77_000949 [Saxophila tyrrhenica]